MVAIDREHAEKRIGKNIAALFNSVDNIMIINLGIGIPTQVSNYITNDNVFLHTENGMLGVGPIAVGDEIHPQLINAGRQPVKETPGCVFFDSSMSFGMIRGGHIDATVLGAFEVDQHGNVANWIIPGGKQLGVGGAMDLVAGANKVIIAMTHTSKGEPKLLKECKLPITGYGRVNLVVTEIAMIAFENGKRILRAMAPDVSIEDIRNATDFDFEVSPELKTMIA